MKKVLLAFALALAAVFLAWSQTNGSHAMNSQLDGTWEQVSGHHSKGMREIKIISAGHFIWVAYDKEKGRPIYTGGGTYVLNETSYTEHVDFMSDEISAGLIGKDQPLTIKMDGDTLTLNGTLSNGESLSESWKRVN